MDEAEFDRLADDYRALHARGVQLFGESPEFFAEYKVADIAGLLAARLPEKPAILDFGAGIGTSVPYFRKYLPRCRLTCLDVSSRCLEIGRGRFVDQAQFIHFAGHHVPFADASLSTRLCSLRRTGCCDRTAGWWPCGAGCGCGVVASTILTTRSRCMP